MTDRVSSENLQTIRTELARSGGTQRPELRLPSESGPSLSTDVVRVTIDGSDYHAPVDEVADSVALRGAYDNPRLARERDGPDRLAAWLEDVGLAFGRTVLLDVIEPGSQYGLRAPGQDAVYHVRPEPDGDLQDIARSLE